MRYVNTVQQKSGKKRVMLVENSQDPRYQDGVICYSYVEKPDGPADGGQFYPGCTIEEVKAELEELYKFPQSGWIAVPDQVVGCREDWIAPVVPPTEFCPKSGPK
jgi:hypothetical protein